MVHIRTATAKHAATLAEFQVLMARETEGMELDPPTVLRGVRAVVDDPAKGAYYVAEDAGRLVGCLLITPEWSEWRNGWFWWIQSVYVVPEARRRGVFQALYGHIRQRVEQSPDIRGLRLYVDKRNIHAQKVYEVLGMAADHYRMYEWDKR